MNSEHKFTQIDFDPFAGKEIEKVIATNESQKEVWLSCVLGGKNANLAYNESVSLRFDGNLNVDALTRSVYNLVRRHEALRSTVSNDGESLFIYSDFPFDFKEENISSLDKNKQEEYLTEFIRHEMNNPFDLEEGPLFRFFLHRLSNTSSHFTIFKHHIIGDGWSTGVMLEDLSKMYNAYSNNEDIQLPFAPQISDYSEQEIKFKQSEEYKNTEAYWLNQFKDGAPEMEIPTDYRRVAPRTYGGNRFIHTIAKNEINKLKSAGAKAGCSLVNTLLNAFEVYLYHITGSKDIVVGLPAAGQSATGNFGLVGHYVNLMPLRSKIDPESSFVDFLKKRKPAFFDAYDNQRLTFGELIKKLNIKRDSTKIPLVPVVFNIDMGMDNAVAFNALQYQLISNKREFEVFDIFLNVTGSKDTFILEWCYNTQIFKEETIVRMMDEFATLLQTIAADPTGKIKDFFKVEKQVSPTVSKRTAYQVKETVIDLFSIQAKKFPAKTAVVSGIKKLTYRELDEKSNQVAHYLKKKGVTKETLVSVCLERSLEIPLAYLGILKAGGAYLPFDPLYPKDRISNMLEDSASKIIITSKECLDRLPKAAGNDVIVLEESWSQIGKESTADPVYDVTPSSLAYIIYTSGSTGKPKGAMIEHGNIVNLVQNSEFVSLTSKNILLCTASPSFDVATFEYWGMLLNGGQLVICREEALFNSTMLKNEIVSRNVDLMWFTTGLFNQWVDSDITVFQTLKTIVVGGEKLSEKHMGKLRETYPNIILINGYGPTENSVFSTAYTITDRHIVNTIPIGKPFHHRTAYVLNPDLQLCPVGVAGELCVGGPGIGRGYYNRSELTNEKFINNPFAEEDGYKKLYKTGDLVKQQADGNIEYVGRIDDQVKIRGYRIELGEIDTVLKQCPGVKDSVIVVNENNGEKRLIAYVVPEGTFDKEVAIKFIQTKLPPYMTPKVYIQLDKIPLTNNGKADRNALPKPDQTQLTEGNQFVEPTTDFQKIIAEAWAEILGLKKISITDDFFEIGGHSLLALKAMLLLEKRTGRRLPLALLLEYSTIEKLSNVIEANAKQISWDCFVPIKTSGSKMPIYFIHGAGLNVLTFRSISKYLDAEQPVYGLQAKGLNGKDVPLNNMEEIAAHYIQEIFKQNPHGPYALAGYSFGGLIAFEMARQLKEMGKEVAMLGVFDTFARQSDYYDPLSKKIPDRIKTFFNKIWCTLVLMKDDPWFIMNYRLTSLRKKTVAVFRQINSLVLKKNPDHFHVYSERIIKNLFVAARDYKFMPYDGKVDLFRAKRKAYYLPDFEFLGWKKYAIKGVDIHDVPGHHTEMFDPPHAEELARVLQACLDKANGSGQKNNTTNLLRAV